jgi:hypothetical protein
VAKEAIYSLYILERNCDACGARLVISSAARMPDAQNVNIKASCMECGKAHDVVYDLLNWEGDADTEIPYWYPENVKLPDGIRGNIYYLHELHTNRNLKALSILWHSIGLLGDGTHKELLKLCFSANLSKASKINVPKVSGKGWTAADYDAYNIPDNFIEFNVWDGFANKFHQCLEAKEQTNELIGDSYTSGKIVNASAEDMTFIPENSVDYVLTDPPYACEIRYHERSFVRNTWLGFESKYPPKEYVPMMQQALLEIHRVLKPQGHLSVLLRGTEDEFRDELVSLARNARLTHEKTDLEFLGYGDRPGEPADHVLNFVNYA